LLAAGWPGLERRIALAAQPVPISNILTMPRISATSLLSGNGVVESLAATAEQPKQLLHRLPLAWFTDTVPDAKPQYAIPAVTSPGIEDAGIASRLARIQGIVLHALLERAATGASGDHPDWEHLTDALLRQHGLTRTDTAAASSAILQGMRNTLAHEEGRWLLMARDSTPGARSLGKKSWTETSWNIAKDSRVIGQRPDRVFLAGESPGAPSADYLWIIDYKTAALPEGADRDAFLAACREQYRSQLESYSDLFRKLRDVDEAADRRQHRLAIYHPMLPWLDWWSA
jgi:ATP-dependent exoDNAse (exonuclease V) beta subunit